MSFQSAVGDVKVEVSNNVATITFGHPASNSFPSLLLKQLTAEINNMSNRDDIHVLILKSFGESAFCAGASFNELLQIENSEQGQAFFEGFANVINAMRKCQQLIIGRIQGKAVGGGVGLAAACDYVFATATASIKLSEIAIGIGPFVIEPAVSRKLGKNNMMKLTLNPTDWFSASWAKDVGLFFEVFENCKEMDLTVNAFAAQLSQYSFQALAEMKKVYWENTKHWDDLLMERAAISGKLILSAEAKAAINALKK